MLRQRIITALILAALVLGAIFWLPSDITAAVITLLVLAGAWEWAAFAGLKQPLGRLAYSLLIGGCIAFVWSHGTNSPRADQLLSAALIWWFVALVWVATMPSVGNRGSAALAGILVLVPAWLALIRLHQLAPFWLLFLLLLVSHHPVGAENHPVHQVARSSKRSRQHLDGAISGGDRQVDGTFEEDASPIVKVGVRSDEDAANREMKE